MERNPIAEKSVSLTTNKFPLAGIFLKTEFRLISLINGFH